MIHAVCGSNAFLLKAETDRLIQEFITEFGEIGLQRIDGEEASYDSIREALESLPFLASKKLVVLRSPSANKEFAQHAEKLLPSVSESTDVLIVEPKVDKRSSYYKYLKKSTNYQEFNELDEHGVVNWLVAQAKTLGANLAIADARYLVERLGINQQILNSELNKLVAYDEQIDHKNIDLLTEPNPQSTIFQLIDAAFSGNQRIVMKLYAQQRASNVEPQQIIAMLGWQLHVLAVLKTAGDRDDSQIARDAKLNPFVVRKSRVISNKLQPAKLQKLIYDLTELDTKLKTSKVDADEALKHYLFAMTGD